MADLSVDFLVLEVIVLVSAIDRTPGAVIGAVDDLDAFARSVSIERDV